MFKIKILKVLFLLISLSSFYACSSPSVVKFSSTPSDADVTAIDGSNTTTNLGKTPLTINDSDVYKNSGQYSQVKISKAGFTDQNILLMRSIFGSDVSVNVELKKDENIQNIGEQSIVQEKVASAIARANGLIQSKQYAEAEMVMLNFIEQFPSVSVGYDYLGNLNYLQKKYPNALKYYGRAMGLNPQNADRRLIVEKIQNLVKSQSGEAQ